MVSYILDTNVIQPLKFCLDEESSLFNSLWTKLSDMLDRKQIIFSRIYYEIELANIDEEKNYFKKLITEDNLIDVDEEIQEQFSKIVNKFPSWINVSGTKNKGDVWIVAFALCNDLTVVTNESFDPKRIPKIPSVCNHFGVRCISGDNFFKEISE